MTFAEKLIAAVESAEAGADTEHARRFRAVLDQFVEALHKLGVGARIDTLRDPRRLGLWLHAPHRPERGSIMLTFFLDGDAIVVSGESPRSIATPEDFELWLLEFVKRSEFIESLRLLREEAQQPVEARLQVSADAPRGPGNVIVAVPAADQKRLAETGIGETIQFEIERVDFPGNPPFADPPVPPAYAVLDSAGLVVRLHEAKKRGENKLGISGTRIV